jgi:peroxiredoxin family protein
VTTLATHTESAIADRLAALEEEVARLSNIERERSKRLSLVVLSGSSDRLLAAFNLALGAAAMGIQVTMFFAFWGITALRVQRRFSEKSLCERAMSAMLPSCASDANPSCWSFGGLGKRLLRCLMRRHGLMQLEDMIAAAGDLGVRFVCCETSTMLLGIRADELLSGVQPGGVATFLDSALDSQAALVV